MLILVRFLDHFEMREDKEQTSMEGGQQPYGEQRRVKMRENVDHMLA